MIKHFLLVSFLLINRRCFFIIARVLKKNKNELLDVLEDYMADCKYRDLRRTTIMAYEQSLRLLFKFLKDDYKVIYVKDVKEEHIINYIDFTKERGKYSYATNEKNTSDRIYRVSDFHVTTMLFNDYIKICVL